MKINDFTYKGFSYTLLFADKGDWGKHLYHFHTECPHNFDGGFDKSFEIVKNNIEQQIDDFLNKTPTTIEELTKELAELLVWTGYEDCHFDEKAANKLITAYIQNL